MLKLKFQKGHLRQADNSLENLDAGKDRGQKEKRVSEIEMAGQHHRLNGHGFEQAPGVGDG